MSIILLMSSLLLGGVSENNVSHPCLDSRVSLSNGDVATKFVLNGKSHLLLTERHPHSKRFKVNDVEYYVYGELTIEESFYWVGFTRNGSLVKSGLFIGDKSQKPVIEGLFVKLFQLGKDIYVISEDFKNYKTIVSKITEDMSKVKDIYETDGRPTDSFLDMKTRALSEKGYLVYQLISGYPNWAIAITNDGKVHEMQCEGKK